MLKTFTYKQQLPQHVIMSTRDYTPVDEKSSKQQRRQPFGTTEDHVSRKRHDWLETDKGEWDFVPTFPAVSQARTTFHVVDLEDIDEEDERRWNRLWCLQHNRGHTWDKTAKTTVRADTTYRRCTAILQQCEIPDWSENVATSRVLHEDLTGFSRHYAGADGACIGFALLELYDTPDEAQESFYANRASNVIPDLDAEDMDGLIDYVFRKYRGDL